MRFVQVSAVVQDSVGCAHLPNLDSVTANIGRSRHGHSYHTKREAQARKAGKIFLLRPKKNLFSYITAVLKSSLFRRKHSRKSEAVACTAVMCSLAMAFLEKVRVRRAQSALPGGEASSREHGHFSTHRALHPSGAQKADSE